MWERRICLSTRQISTAAYYVVSELILYLSIRHGRISKHLELENSFPNGHLTEPLYRVLPKSLFPNVQKNGRVMKLQKCVYGLKNTARACYKVFVHSSERTRVKNWKRQLSYLSSKKWWYFCHFIDQILFAEKVSSIDETKRNLRNKFRAEDLEKPREFFRLEAKRQPDASLYISQTQMMNKLLQKTSFQKSKRVRSPTSRS